SKHLERSSYNAKTRFTEIAWEDPDFPNARRGYLCQCFDFRLATEHRTILATKHSRFVYGHTGRKTTRARARVEGWPWVAQYRQATFPCRAKRQSGAAGLLDLRLHQLYAHHPGSKAAGTQVRQSIGRHRGTLGE